MMATSSPETEEIPKWKLAREGLNLLINNKPDEAEALFKKYPDSLEMFAGYTFSVFMDALMGFEEDKLNLATATLKEAEQRCAAEFGWIKSMKSRMFGTESFNTEMKNLERQIILADSQVCLAILLFLQQDFSSYFKGGWILRKSWKLYQHAYNEIKELYVQYVGELPDQISVQKKTNNLIEEGPSDIGETSPDDPVALASLSPSNGYTQNSRPFSSKMSHSYTTGFNPKEFSCYKCSSNCSNNNNSNKSKLICDNCSYVVTNGLNVNPTSTLALKKSRSVNSALSKRLVKNGLFFHFPSFNHSLSFSSFTSAFNVFSVEKCKFINIDKESITRLLGAVSFGYGLFHLGISLLPPQLVKVSNFLGFNGNRSTGIANLMYARLGVDMRAPLATLSLLWYHTIVRPFYAIDGSNLQAGVEASMQLIHEAQTEYSDSAIFLFFKGRLNRLKSDIPEALKSFQASVENTTHREIRILSYHEVGWCYLIQLNYGSAESTFQILRSTSRWSRPFYAYLEMICAGSRANLKDPLHVKELRSYFENIPKGSQLEVLLIRRYKCCPDIEDTVIHLESFWRMFVYELLYLWNTLPNCQLEDIQKIIADCESITDPYTMEPMAGLSKLIGGYCYYLLKEFDKAIGYFKECLEIRKDKTSNCDDAHVSAFAEYELGNILMKSSESAEEGKAFLQHISYYKDYDFEQRLTIRIHTQLKLN